MAGEGGNNNASFGMTDKIFERFSYFAFRPGKTLRVGIRGIAHEQVHAHLRETRHGGKIGTDTINGRLVKLEVARVQDIPCRRLHKSADRARDRVIHREELNSEATHFDLLTGFDFNELCILDAMLFEFQLDKPQRHFGGINGNLAIQVFQQIRQAARMVFVAMRDENTTELMRILQDIRVIRQNKIDSRMIVIGEHQARIIDDHILTALKNGHIATNYIQTT